LFKDPKRRLRIPFLKRWIRAAAKQAKLGPQRGTWPAAFVGSAQGYRERSKGFNTEKWRVTAPFRAVEVRWRKIIGILRGMREKWHF